MNLSVLVVDDEPDHREICRAVLMHSGYDVLEASDGEEAIRLARTESPDAILMDVSIPRIDGWEATRILKADEATARIPIIALTAFAVTETREKAARAGCDAYLAKPIEPHGVVEEIRRHIGDPRPGRVAD
jgi:two-component system, cell cycle response regulator DivK